MSKHKELSSKWAVLKFGVKTMVKNDPSTPTQQTINNILSNENYQGVETMQNIIDSIERNSKLLQIDVDMMNDKILKMNVVDSVVVKG